MSIAGPADLDRRVVTFTLTVAGTVNGDRDEDALAAVARALCGHVAPLAGKFLALATATAEWTIERG